MKKITRFIAWREAADGKRLVRVLRLFSHRGVRLMLHRAPKECHWDGRFGVSHEGSGYNVARAGTPTAAVRMARERIDCHWAEVPKRVKTCKHINPNARRDTVRR